MPSSEESHSQWVDSSVYDDAIYDDHALTCSGLIQPYGVLLIFSAESYAIRVVSANVADLLQISCDVLLSNSFLSLLSESDQHWLKQLQPRRYQRSLIFTHLSAALTLTLLPHPLGWLCELEPVSQDLESDSDRLLDLQMLLEQVTHTTECSALLDQVLAYILKITGFERSLVYQFDPQHNGVVLAEARSSSEVESYLGLHFPASDIPAVVRQLYMDGGLRYVPDLAASFQPLVIDSEQLAGHRVDLRASMLRGVDSCCIEYHTNMGVQAFIDIPIRVNQQLWGLIALHDSSPHSLSWPVRNALGVLGHVLSVAISNALNVQAIAYQQNLKRIQSELIRAFSESEKFEEVIIHPDLQLLELVQAQGAAICLDNGVTLVGDTPSVDQVFELLPWAQAQVNDFIYATHQLPREFASAQTYQTKAAGILLLRISEQQNFSILWFRSEKVQAIDWAGNPNQVVQKTEEQLGPRQSFAHWQELIRGTTTPWLEAELEAVLGLRAAISGIALRRADQLAKINQELERSNEELASFAYAASHDLKEPLRGIYNYTTFLIEDYADLLDEAGLDRMHALLRLTKRMDQLIDALLKFSQMRQVELTLRSINLQRLLDNVVSMMQMSRPESSFEVRFPRPLPTIAGDAVLLNELFSNLISNALKYNESDFKQIEVGFVSVEEQQSGNFSESVRQHRQSKVIFFVRDNGIGIRLRHQKSIFRLFKRLHARDRYGGGTGAGLTIVQKIVQRHGGQIWVESSLGAGSTFWFTLT